MWSQRKWDSWEMIVECMKKVQKENGKHLRWGKLGQRLFLNANLINHKHWRKLQRNGSTKGCNSIRAQSDLNPLEHLWNDQKTAGHQLQQIHILKNNFMVSMYMVHTYISKQTQGFKTLPEDYEWVRVFVNEKCFTMVKCSCISLKYNEK